MLKNKKIIVSVCIVALVIGGYVVVASQRHYFPFKQTVSVQDASDSTKQRTANTSPKNNNTPTKQDVTSSSDSNLTTNDVPVNTDLKATITQLEQVNQQVLFSATVVNTTKQGSCVLTISSPNDRPVVKTFDSTYKSGTSLCGPLQIPAYEFSYLGSWHVTLRYYSDSQQAIAESDITIK